VVCTTAKDYGKKVERWKPQFRGRQAVVEKIIKLWISPGHKDQRVIHRLQAMQRPTNQLKNLVVLLI